MTTPFARRPAQPADNNPHHHDPNQLALLINPTEHIRRMERSTDTGAMGIDTYVGTNTLAENTYDADIHEAGPNPAPNRKMNLLWRTKEAEARQPSGSDAHGAGMYDLIASGEQIRQPIQVRMGQTPEHDQQYEGHHRVAAGHAVQEDRGPGYGPGSVWLPVKYDAHDYHYVHRDAERQERAANAKIKAQRSAQEPEVGGGSKPLPTISDATRQRYGGSQAGTTTRRAVDWLGNVRKHGVVAANDMAVVQEAADNARRAQAARPAFSPPKGPRLTTM